MVIVKTKVTKTEHIALNKSLFRVRSLPFVIIYNIIILICGILMFIDENMFFGTLLLLVLIIFDLFIFFMSKYNVNKIYKSNKVMQNEVEFTYQFDEEQIDINVKSVMGINHGILKYEFIYRVIEDSKYFYIFVNSMSAYIVKKENLINSEFEYIKGLLNKNVKRYKKIK